MDDNTIYRALGRIEGLLEGIDEKLDRGTQRMDDHDKRLRDIESDTAATKRVSSVLGSVAGSIFGVAGGLVASWFGR